MTGKAWKHAVALDVLNATTIKETMEL